MKEVSVWLVACVMIAAATWYSYQIWRQKIIPTLSTWIIFLTGTTLSIITYAIAEKHDFKSGILNTMDVLTVSTVLLATLLWGKREVRFKSFERWYLFGISLIIIYGLLSGDAWSSNIFTQALISIGYIPTIQNLATQKKNSESFIGWGLVIVAGVIALYPATIAGNTLAVIYAVRSMALVSIIIALMTYYEFRRC